MIDQTGLHVLTVILLATSDSCHGFAGPATCSAESGSKTRDADVWPQIVPSYPTVFSRTTARAYAAHQSSVSSDQTRRSQLVPRVSLEDYLASPICDRPVLIHNIVNPNAVASLAENLLELLGNEVVQMQRKIRCSDDIKTAQTEIYDLFLKETIEYMMVESSHEDSFFAFCEGLLPPSPSSSIDVNNELSKISNQLTQIREAPFQSKMNGGENWFDHFPSSIRPTDAVILAGCGSTSTLHRDPFEWTGTSLCLEGTKIWRFMLPPSMDEGGVSVVDEALRSYRLDSVAWDSSAEDSEKDDGDSLVLSAGWQSDLSLYESSRSEDVPSAMELLEMEEDNEDAYIVAIETMGCDPSCLGPDAKAQSALQTLKRSDSMGGPGFVTAVQRAGDLLLIPAHCWHQTYAPVPSIAVASQRCGAEVDGANVVGHVLSTLITNGEAEASTIPDILRREQYEEGMGRVVVHGLLEYLASIRRYM